MPEEKQRKSMRTSELDKMINKLQSLDRVDGTSEYYKNNAIAYLSDLANYLDRIGVKTIKMRQWKLQLPLAHITKNSTKL